MWNTYFLKTMKHWWRNLKMIKEVEIYLMFCVVRINIDNMTIVSKRIYRYNVVTIKILMKFSTELEQIILRCIWTHGRPWIAKATLKKKKKELSWRHQSTWLQTALKSYSNQNRCSWNKIKTHRSMEQKSNPEVNPWTHGQFMMKEAII